MQRNLVCDFFILLVVENHFGQLVLSTNMSVHDSWYLVEILPLYKQDSMFRGERYAREWSCSRLKVTSRFNVVFRLFYINSSQMTSKWRKNNTGAVSERVTDILIRPFSEKGSRRTKDDCFHVCGLQQLRAVECWNMNVDYDSSDSTILPKTAMKVMYRFYDSSVFTILP